MIELNFSMAANSSVTPAESRLTPETLWKGLLFKTYQPALFNSRITSCDFSNQQETQNGFLLTRQTVAEGVLFIEQVTLIPDKSIIFEQTSPSTRSRVEYHIHCDDPRNPFLQFRFRLEDDEYNPAHANDSPLGPTIRIAYMKSVQSTLSVIRGLASEGRLESVLPQTLESVV